LIKPKTYSPFFYIFGCKEIAIKHQKIMEAPEYRSTDLDLPGSDHLNETRKWTMFLSILGFIVIGIMLVLSIVILGSRTAFGFFGAFPMILLMIVYFFPIYFLFRFSSYSRQAIAASDRSSYDEAMKYLKYHYRFIGILAIIGTGLYIIAIIAMMTGGPLLRELFQMNGMNF
jgi:hypothetical protein